MAEPSLLFLDAHRSMRFVSANPVIGDTMRRRLATTITSTRQKKGSRSQLDFQFLFFPADFFARYLGRFHAVADRTG